MSGDGAARPVPGERPEPIGAPTDPLRPTGRARGPGQAPPSVRSRSGRATRRLLAGLAVAAAVAAILVAITSWR